MNCAAQRTAANAAAVQLAPEKDWDVYMKSQAPTPAPYSSLSGMRIRHRFYHSFFLNSAQHYSEAFAKNALVRLSAVLAPKQSDDHTYTVGTCLLLICFSIQSIFYRSKDGGDFVFTNLFED